MASSIERLVTNAKSLADVRLQPIKLKGDANVVLRSEMEDVIRQWNENLQRIQQGLNEAASVLKTTKTE